MLHYLRSNGLELAFHCLLALLPAAALFAGFELKRQCILYKTDCVLRVERMLSAQVTPSLRAFSATGAKLAELEEQLEKASADTARVAGVEQRFLDRYEKKSEQYSEATQAVSHTLNFLTQCVAKMRVLRAEGNLSTEQQTLIDSLLSDWGELTDALFQLKAE